MSARPTDTRRLSFLAETPLARLYADAEHRQQWIPRSVCAQTLKHPSQNGQPPLHVVAIESWWLSEHPFAALQPKEKELL